MSMHYVGVDVGGTFTDIVAVNQDTGELSTRKVPSTPPTFIEGIIGGLRQLDFPMSQIGLFIHGSTIGTNAIIERKGPPTALITTEGFRDVVLIGRATKPDVYDLRWRPGEPMVKRRNIFEVPERVRYDGSVHQPLDEDAVRALKPRLEKRGIRSVAISFLNSFMNPAHELRAREIVKELCPDLHVSTSFEVFPEIREFERTSTVVANAYIAPLLDNYLETLLAQMRGDGFTSDVLVVHSGGGVMSDASARRIPARTCYSGPAGGVMGGAYIGKLAGFPNVITMDMGGTSCDVAVVRDGRPLVTPGLHIEHNIPVRFPSIDVHTIGAGGGSIAWIDRGGSLHNGPQSAGARPGPACYGRGGTLPTNTDAQIVLGRLTEKGLIGGGLPLQKSLAEEAIRKHVAEPFGWTLEEAADSVLRLADANMINAIRLVSVQRGHDPRDFALVAFGGAGPLHGVDVARDLKIPTVIVPLAPGLASAFGQLHVDLRHDLIRPYFKRETLMRADELNRLFEELEEEGRALLHEEGIPADRIQLQRLVEMKYFPQSFYLTLAVPAGKISQADVERLVQQYNERHKQEFGYNIPRHAAEVEIGQVRLVATGLIDKPELTSNGARPSGRSTAPVPTRSVYFRDAGGWVETRIYDRATLSTGDRIEGPAIVEQFDSTTVLPPAVSAGVDRYHNLIVSV